MPGDGARIAVVLYLERLALGRGPPCKDLVQFHGLRWPKGWLITFPATRTCLQAIYAGHLTAYEPVCQWRIASICTTQDSRVTQAVIAPVGHIGTVRARQRIIPMRAVRNILAQQHKSRSAGTSIDFRVDLQEFYLHQCAQQFDATFVHGDTLHTASRGQLIESESALGMPAVTPGNRDPTLQTSTSTSAPDTPILQLGPAGSASRGPAVYQLEGTDAAHGLKNAELSRPGTCDLRVAHVLQDSVLPRPDICSFPIAHYHRCHPDVRMEDLVTNPTTKTTTAAGSDKYEPPSPSDAHRPQPS